MSDCEETDFFWELWTSPGKRKRKKSSKKCPNGKNDITTKKDENVQKEKKKKNSKFKDAMARRKAQKKEKKKKKNRLALELDDSLTFTQASSAQAKPAVKPGTSNPHSSDWLKPDLLTQDCRKKTKRKKKVVFDLSPGYICVKRPKFVSSSPQCPKESILLDGESCSQVTVTGHSQRPTHDDDSQCTSEDINSQDLFITQKTFRVSPSQPSSCEASDRAVTATPQVFTQRDKLHTSESPLKQQLQGSYKYPQDRKTSKHEEKPKTVQVLLTEEEEEEGSNDHNRGKLSFQTQMEFNANLTEKKESCPVRIKPRVNPYLTEPVVVKPSLDEAKSKKHSCSSNQQSTTSTSTQTENMFTTELSSYLNFCQTSRVTAHFDDLRPLDLSLPERARKDRTCLSVKTSSLKDPNLHPSCSSGVKDAEVKKEAPGRHPWSVSTGNKGETTLSPQYESEPKSGDTTTSSEDIEPPCRYGKLDLTQVRAVQMRLNESFFFKTKGEGQSPRPESPLMKLAQSRHVKSRKGH